MRFRIATLAILVLLEAVALQADVMTSTSCSVTDLGSNVSNNTGPISCDASFDSPSGDGGQATANIFALLTGPVPGSPTSGIEAIFRESSQTDAVSGSPPSLSSYVTAHAEVLGTAQLSSLFTTGPIRSGFIKFNELVDVGYGGDPAQTNTVTIKVGSLSTHCSYGIPTGATCSGNLGPANGQTFDPLELPFTLGQSFAFSESVDMDAYGGSGAFAEEQGGLSDGRFDFTLLEADGQTPVQIYVGPEPGTSGLIAVGIVTAFAVRRSMRLRPSKRIHPESAL